MADKLAVAREASRNEGSKCDSVRFGDEPFAVGIHNGDTQISLRLFGAINANATHHRECWRVLNSSLPPHYPIGAV
jgi:hypothetical protein